MDMKKYITLLENNSKPKEVVTKPVQPKTDPEPTIHISESYKSSTAVKNIVRKVMEKKNPEPPKPRNPVAKNANAAVGGGAAGKHKDRKKDAKQGVQKHKGQQLDEYFEKEKPTDGELLLLMKKYRLAKISGKPLGSVMRQSDIHKLIDAEKDGRIEALKYRDSIEEKQDDDHEPYADEYSPGHGDGAADDMDDTFDHEHKHDEGQYDSKGDFKRRELEHELGHETRSGSVYIDGRYWKTFDDYKQAQNVAKSLERKGKNATVRIHESYGSPSPAQKRFNRALEKQRNSPENTADRESHRKRLDAIMPPPKKDTPVGEKMRTPFAGAAVGHKEGPAGQLKAMDPKGYPKGKLVGGALEEGRVCPQCGSSKCSCPPGKCKCKPVAGFKPKMSEDKDPCWDNYKMVGTKKKGGKTVPNCVPKESRVGEAQNAAQQAAIAIAKKKKKEVAEAQLDELDRPSGKLYIIITADNAGAPHVFGDFGSFPQDVMHKIAKRGTRDKSGAKTKLKIDFLFDDFRTTIQHLRIIFRDLDFIGAEAAEFIIKSSALRSDQGEEVKHLRDYIQAGDDRRMKMYQAPEDDEEEDEPTGGNILRIDPETGAARRVVGVKPQTQMGGKSTEQPGMTSYKFKDPRFAQQLRGMNMGFNIKGDTITVDQKQKAKLVSMLGDKFGQVFTGKELFKEGGDKYKIKSIGSDVDKESGERRDYYISPSTGKKVYKKAKVGDHENPKSGEHKPKVEGRLSQAIMKEFGINEVSPPGFKGTVKAMKKHKDINNPFALAWSMKNKGYKSHKKADGSDKE